MRKKKKKKKATKKERAGIGREWSDLAYASPFLFWRRRASRFYEFGFAERFFLKMGLLVCKGDLKSNVVTETELPSGLVLLEETVRIKCAT